MSFTANNYDNAERTLFVRKERRLPNGKWLYEILPFSIVNIDGETFYEPHHEPTPGAKSTNLGSEHGAPPNKFVHIQVLDEDHPLEYDGDYVTFEKHNRV